MRSIDNCDGLDVARGDLGVEMDVALDADHSEDLVRRCHAGRQHRDSSTPNAAEHDEESSPTRAKLSDSQMPFRRHRCDHASGEPRWQVPVETVRMMAHIAEITEEYSIRFPRRMSRP